MDGAREYALSLKQPWAALVVAGLKTIEIRRWPSVRRGLIFVHAARSADERPHGWDLVPARLCDLVRLSGGLIGTVEITNCVTYHNKDEFLRDQPKHLNHPSWYDGSTVYGFTLANPSVVRFRQFPGWVRFFRVDGDPKPYGRSGKSPRGAT